MAHLSKTLSSVEPCHSDELAFFKGFKIPPRTYFNCLSCFQPRSRRECQNNFAERSSGEPTDSNDAVEADVSSVVVVVDVGDVKTSEAATAITKAWYTSLSCSSLGSLFPSAVLIKMRVLT